jgi:predicted phosphodiesterase
MAATMRKTRFVCVSDTHNATANGTFKLPKGDVFIHAGDLTNQGSFAELQKTVKWIEEADFEAKIVVAGKMNITMDKVAFLLQQETMILHSIRPSIINMG